MQTRHIGPLEVSAIALGCMGLSQGYGATTPEQGAAALRAALDAGVTLFDTAMSYGQGANEELLGATLGPHTDHALVATKFGIVRGPDGVSLDGDPAGVRAYAEASLRRLRREVIDLYYLHRVDPRFPVEETVGAMAELVDAGLVRALGVSEVTPGQLRAAASVADVSALQLEWSLAWRTPEEDVLPVARELGVAVVPYSPLGRGLLTASAESRDPGASPFRQSDPRFAADNQAANLATVEALGAVAARLGATTAQVALAWLLHQGSDVVPLPGTRDPRRVAENVAAAGIDLDRAALAELDSVSAGFVGDRHSFAAPSVERRR